ncbi:Hypothetical protein NTJ_11451 [Nesidiocoris tenuis]|uniref:Uncharacterized protein n=1 Tax=Nesidiocoris tenuis TaxID=355587 RepID=A0ABN7B2K6_9HEMI|nr:Hypothetical protein NTJ_11451 [Nesidiocoris tenuis]
MADSQTAHAPQPDEMNAEESSQDPSQDEVDAVVQEQDEFVTNVLQRSKPFVDGISNLTRQCATITLKAALMVHPQLFHQLDEIETNGNQLDSLVVLGQAKKSELTLLTDDDDDVEQLLNEIDNLALADDGGDEEI